MDKGCKECKDRHEGCHSSCESYREWKKSYDAKKAIIQSERERQRAIASDIKARIQSKSNHKFKH